MLLDTPGGPGHPTCRPRGSHGWLPLSPAEPRPADSPFLPSRSPGGPPLPPPHSPTGPPELRAGTPHPPAPCPVPLGADWPWVLSEGVKVAQSCPTLDDPMDCSPPGSSVHRILQARIQEWVALPFSRGSSQPRSPALWADFFPVEPQRKPLGPEAEPKPDVRLSTHRPRPVRPPSFVVTRSLLQGARPCTCIGPVSA